ncbi:hypothetical protein PZ938_16600 [Luteipulveratus sp. YIM 133132]|uniref:hypothetical protein n=1 Tax=Luteipulveratus flavus TaxID=3031728 RepID=UPI0023AF573B|nr:hypothetical protein [Luteipulveratus sp. YIM 133132]MDE9367241.1 hypothetical protein [Luteipulveratus sp. YIM 133132]
MTANVVVPLLVGVLALLSVVWAARAQARAAEQHQMRQARIDAYADCARRLYLFRGATINRCKSRFAGDTGATRNDARQHAYETGAEALAAIARIQISGDRAVHQLARDAYKAVQSLNREETGDALEENAKAAADRIEAMVGRFSDMGASKTTSDRALEHSFR